MTASRAPRLSLPLLIGIPLVTVLVSGVTVHVGLGLVFGLPWVWSEAGDSLLRAALYVSIMWTALILTFRWTVVHWPLAGPRDVVRHVATVVAAGFLSFVVASGLHRLLFDDTLPGVVFAIISVVSALATAVLATILYGALAWQRLREAEAAALRAELRALRAQINPHFLFNALNTIAALVRIRPQEAERVTEHLADLFRYSLAASDRPTVRLAEELESAETYLAIEQARFGGDMHIEIDVPPDLRQRPVPSLVLQPLVENAVQHGLRASGECGTVTIRARGGEGKPLAVEVLDTGAGFGTDQIGDVLGRGTGLTNVHERLRGALGGDAGLRLVPGGIAIDIPAHA
ncbi:MAG: histidine kinase [Bacteroidota bacterium]